MKEIKQKKSQTIKYISDMTQKILDFYL